MHVRDRVVVFFEAVPMEHVTSMRSSRAKLKTSVGGTT